MPTSRPENADELLRAKLNLETSQMQWKDLLRYFSAGMFSVVSRDLDLFEVVLRISIDDKDAVAQWMKEQRVLKGSDAQASAWMEADALLWTVVVKPWILVQAKRLH